MDAMDDLVRQFFTKEGRILVLNPALELDLADEQDRAKFLLKVIHHWGTHHTLFCGDTGSGWSSGGLSSGNLHISESKRELRYKTPSQCELCVFCQGFLDKIFGDHKQFNSLPFVTYLLGREYAISFALLEFFAEYGREATEIYVQQVGELKDHRLALNLTVRELELRQERRRKLAEQFGNQEISSELATQLSLQNIDPSLVIANPRIAAMIDSRVDHDDGNLNYWDQVVVFCSDQRQLQEWMWGEDKKGGASTTDSNLCIKSLGRIEIDENDGTTTVRVEILNQHGNRTATFKFDRT